MKTSNLRSGKVVLFLIILIASFFRFYELSNVPPHLTPDEAALGYNAFSILKTGRDEHGEFLPFIFKSFGDNKPGLYVYLTVPIVFLFGLNEFSTRFVGALSGVLAVFFVYKIARNLYKNSRILPFMSAIILALSPWHIHFSRGAWEVNVALTLTLIGIHCFLLYFTNAKKQYLLLSFLFFALTTLTYQGAKLSTLIVFVLLVASYFREVRKIEIKTLISSLVLGFVVCFPILLSLFVGEAGRLKVVSVFSNPRPEQYLMNILSQGEESVGNFSYYLFHSESFNFLRGIAGRWFNHFSGRFLFFEGDWQNLRHSAPYVGMLNLLDFPLLVFGSIALVKLKDRRASIFVFLWLITACLPSILSRDQVHSVRSLNMVIPITLLSTLGAGYFINKFKNNKKIILGGGILYLLGFVYYADSYFVHLPKQRSQSWEYGYKKAVEAILPIKDEYNAIVFQQSYSQPYVYFLFYGKYDPLTFQKNIKKDFVDSPYGDVGQVQKLDNIVFTGIDWPKIRGDSGLLVVGDSMRIPEVDSSDPLFFEVISNIKYLDGKETALRIVGIK